jgi:PEGA domain
MPTGTVLAYSIPDGAYVLIDNASVSTRFSIARTPALIPEISAGTHNITFRLHGYVENTMVIQIQQGGYTTVTAILNPKTKPSA